MALIMPDIPFHSGEMMSDWQLTILLLVCIGLACVWLWSQYRLKLHPLPTTGISHSYQRLLLAKDCRLHVIQYDNQSFLVFETAGQLVQLQQSKTEKTQ